MGLTKDGTMVTGSYYNGSAAGSESVILQVFCGRCQPFPPFSVGYAEKVGGVTAQPSLVNKGCWQLILE